MADWLLSHWNFYAAGVVLAMLGIWQFWPAISVWWNKPRVTPTTPPSDARTALDTALALKLHFPAGSPGRTAMAPVIAELIKELEA